MWWGLLWAIVNFGVAALQASFGHPWLTLFNAAAGGMCLAAVLIEWLMGGVDAS